MDGGAWWAAVHGVEKSRTWLSDFTCTIHFHALEKEMATHSSVLAWEIPGTEEPGGLPSMGSHRVRHDWSNLAAAAAARSWSHIPGHHCCLPNVPAYSEGKATLPTVDGVQGLTRMTSHTALAWGDSTESLCTAVKGWAHCGRPDAS